MKTNLTIAAGLLVANLSSAALVGTATSVWSNSSTAFDAGVSELYSHLSGKNNQYLLPDSNENRYANAGFISQATLSGLDTIDLFSFGGTSGNTNFLGIRVIFGTNSYELTLTPNSKVDTAKRHYFASVNDVLAAAGGPVLEFAGYNGGTVTQTAQVDFFLNDTSMKLKTYASGVDNTSASPKRPAFNFTPDLLTTPGLSGAKVLPASKTAALAFLKDDGFSVWGLEDMRGQKNTPSAMEPDFNDRMFAYRFVKFVLPPVRDPLMPVPEPSTYGLIGSAVLMALIGYRRFSTTATVC